MFHVYQRQYTYIHVFTVIYLIFNSVVIIILLGHSPSPQLCDSLADPSQPDDGSPHDRQVLERDWLPSPQHDAEHVPHDLHDVQPTETK